MHKVWLQFSVLSMKVHMNIQRMPQQLLQYHCLLSSAVLLSTPLIFAWRNEIISNAPVLPLWELALDTWANNWKEPLAAPHSTKTGFHGLHDEYWHRKPCPLILFTCKSHHNIAMCAEKVAYLSSSTVPRTTYLLHTTAAAGSLSFSLILISARDPRFNSQNGFFLLLCMYSGFQ